MFARLQRCRRRRRNRSIRKRAYSQTVDRLVIFLSGLPHAIIIIGTLYLAAIRTQRYQLWRLLPNPNHWQCYFNNTLLQLQRGKIWLFTVLIIRRFSSGRYFDFITLNTAKCHTNIWGSKKKRKEKPLNMLSINLNMMRKMGKSIAKCTLRQIHNCFQNSFLSLHHSNRYVRWPLPMTKNSTGNFNVPIIMCRFLWPIMFFHRFVFWIIVFLLYGNKCKTFAQM